MDPQWGARELRGPLWEAVTGLTLLLAGVDLFMMLHPAAVRTLRNTITRLTEKRGSADAEKFASWVSAKF
jgi:acetyl-CoA decarbonylase/synthase complex subunit delta